MTDQELLEEALNRRLTEVAMRYQNRGDIDLVKCIDKNLANHSPDAGNMVALELVQKIRIGDTSNMRDPWDVKQLTDDEAAALIESYGRRVPREMLEDLYRRAWNRGHSDILENDFTPVIDHLVSKYGVKIEEEGE